MMFHFFPVPTNAAIFLPGVNNLVKSISSISSGRIPKLLTDVVGP